MSDAASPRTDSPTVDVASTPPFTSQKEEPKKRGSRQLTQQQLAKKRQNDREAQRAIRERTRNTIEALEKKVKDLEGGHAYRQMQELVQEKEALRAENGELKRRLADIVSLCEPALGNAAHSEQRPSAPSTTMSGDNTFRSPSIASLPPHWPNPSQADDDQHREKRARVSYSDSTQPSPLRHGDSPSRFTPSTTQRGPSRSSLSQSPRSTTNVSSPSNVAMATSANHPYNSLPSHILPTCPFDKILIDYMNECRKRMATGQDLDEVLGPPWPDMKSLLYPETDSTTRPNSLSNLLISTLKGFTSITGLPQKIAICSSSYYIMRWLIAPSQANYELIPDQLKPIDEQIKIPHPIWIDVVHWPELRHKLVHQFPNLSLEAFFYPFTVQVSVNWTFPEDPWSMVERVRRQATKFDGDCKERDGVTEDLRPTEVFERHFRTLENWTTGPMFAETFPWLAGTTKVAYDYHLSR